MVFRFIPHRGGAVIVASEIANNLAKLGHHVTVLTPDFELVGESYTDKGCCVSEKLLKPLLYKKPFICMASRGYHTFLENQGFYLYDEIFDYSFDNSTFENRFKSLMFQIKNILELPTENLKEKIQQINYKIDYNHQLIKTILNDKDRHKYYDSK